MLDIFDFWKFLAGLGIFLIGMFFIEESLGILAGRTFKRVLRKYTNRPFKGILVGTVSTALLQSSSLVSLLVMAFVGAGILQLQNAIGIIFGANLGTTFTGWLVTTFGFKIDIESYALPFIALGSMLFVFIKGHPRLNDLGKLIIGFGFLFLGLSYMKTSMDQFASQVDFSLLNDHGIYIFVLIGFVLTAVIQSSSASLVITLSALNAGLIPLAAAVSVVIGSNLGTTATTILGAINGSSSKKRVALSHFLFNMITALLAIIMLFPLLHFIRSVLNVSDALFTLVAFNTIFNLMGVIVMFPFIRIFSRFLDKRFIKKNEASSIYITNVPPNFPEAAIEAVGNEVKGLLDLVFLNIAQRMKLQEFGLEIQKKQKELNLVYSNRKSLQDNYVMIKQLEGEIVEYVIKIESEKLNREETNNLNKSNQVLKEAMIALKGIKDISHNLDELFNSDNDEKRAMYFSLRDLLFVFYKNLYHLMHSNFSATFFEQLIEFKEKNHHISHQFNEKLNIEIRKTYLSDVEISTLLTLNREIYFANKRLLNAVRNLLLSHKQLEDFNAISG